MMSCFQKGFWGRGASCESVIVVSLKDAGARGPLWTVLLRADVLNAYKVVGFAQ